MVNERSKTKLFFREQPGEKNGQEKSLCSDLKGQSHQFLVSL